MFDPKKFRHSQYVLECGQSYNNCRFYPFWSSYVSNVYSRWRVSYPQCGFMCGKIRVHVSIHHWTVIAVNVANITLEMYICDKLISEDSIDINRNFVREKKEYILVYMPWSFVCSISWGEGWLFVLLICICRNFVNHRLYFISRMFHYMETQIATGMELINCSMTIEDN